MSASTALLDGPPPLRLALQLKLLPLAYFKHYNTTERWVHIPRKEYGGRSIHQSRAPHGHQSLNTIFYHQRIQLPPPNFTDARNESSADDENGPLGP
eukprot:1179359-Prorocentrum_minimum.AAC.1